MENWTYGMLTKLAALLWLLVFSTNAALHAQFRDLETKDLRLVYYTTAHEFIVPHMGRCFENALSVHNKLFHYKPSEQVTVLVQDLWDYGNAGAYLYSLESKNMLLWIVRGFGTAIMHGGTTAIVGIISKNLIDVRASESPLLFGPGLFFAILVHSAFNHFLLPPLATTLVLLVTFPLLIMLVFEQSEKATRRWLGTGFDTDMEFLAIIISGKISEMRIGQYLETIRDKFPGEVIADMLCMLRIYLELALRAKGLLMMQGTGFKVASDPDIKAKFEELKYLEKSIGRTGKLAMKPLLGRDQRDLWQIYHLSQR